MRHAPAFAAGHRFTALAVLAYGVLVACLVTGSLVADLIALGLGAVVAVYVRRLRTRIANLRAAADELRAHEIDRADRISSYERERRTDAVTGLGNRDHLDAALPRLVADAGTSMSSLAVLVIELDGLARYRDRHGDAEGDRELKVLAGEWQAHMRINDVLVRVGPTDFVAVLPACSPPNADRVAHRLAATLPADLACSVGVASWDGSESHEQLLERAKSAMLAAGAARDHVLVAD